MTQLFQNILTASFHGSVVILVVMLLRLVLKKAPKKFLCFLWLLAGIRLLMPFEIQSDLSLQPALEPMAQVQWQQAEDAGQKAKEPVRTTAPASPTIFQAQAEADSPVPAVSPTISAAPDRSAPVAETRESRESHWTSLLPWLWLGVASLFAIYSIVSYLRLRLKVRTAIRIPGGWECEYIDTAFILGFIRPRIYIPMGLSKTVRRHILAHERTHLEKGDHWFKMIGFIALALHWFNPLVWLAYILLCKDIEMACDERVVQFMDLEERKSYSAALLCCSTNRAHFAACPVAFGEVSVKHRIKSVLNYRKPSFWISLLGVAAIAFVAVCLVTSPTETPAAGDQTAVAATEPEPSDENQEDTQLQLVSDAFDDLLSQDNYHLFFSEETSDGSVGWQIHFYKDGANTLWWSTDHVNEAGGMLLDGVSYRYIDGDPSGWVPFDSEDSQLESILAEFSMEGMEVRDILMEELTGLDNIPYKKLTFTRDFVDTEDNIVVQPISVFFRVDGVMSGMRIENTTRKGADILSFSNWSNDGDIESRFQNARENLLPAETADLTQLLPPTEDEQRMKDWGIQFRVEDDILTRSGSEAWFCQASGYNMVVWTDNEYWLEKKTETGWEKLPLIAEPQWNPASYTLGHEMYTMVAVDWSQLYGPLDGGTYRMGKTFTMMENGSHTCTGYAEFEIFYQEPQTMAQQDAIDYCRNAVEELKSRTYGHFVYSSSEISEEVYWNGDDYVSIREWTMPDMDKINAPIEDPADIPYVTTKAINVRRSGIGYNAVHEVPDDNASSIVGMEVSNLDASDREGENLKESLYLSSFEGDNHIIDFSASDCIISTEKISYHQYWSDPSEYTKLTYWFGQDGTITQMEAAHYYLDLDGFTQTYRIFDTSAEEIDATIRSYTEDLLAVPFSWEEAKAKYTDGTFNIRETDFQNNDMVTISTPIEAARRALQEYPNLGTYLNLEVGFDEAAKMWRVTVRSYYEYQSSEEFRDIYLDSNGVTHLLVYEGPIEWDESRR